MGFVRRIFHLALVDVCDRNSGGLDDLLKEIISLEQISSRSDQFDEV